MVEISYDKVKILKDIPIYTNIKWIWENRKTHKNQDISCSQKNFPNYTSMCFTCFISLYSLMPYLPYWFPCLTFALCFVLLCDIVTYVCYFSHIFICFTYSKWTMCFLCNLYAIIPFMFCMHSCLHLLSNFVALMSYPNCIPYFLVCPLVFLELTTLCLFYYFYLNFTV